LSSEALVAAFTLLAFGIIVAGVAFGSAIGDGIVASKAVEAISRQPEARPNIMTFMFLGVGVLEAGQVTHALPGGGQGGPQPILRRERLPVPRRNRLAHRPVI